MIEELAKTLVNGAANDIGIQVKDLAVIDEAKFVEWAKGKLDLLLTLDEETPVPKNKYHYGALKVSDSYKNEFKFDRMTDNYTFKGVRAKESSFTIFDVKFLLMFEQEFELKSWNALQKTSGIPLQIAARIIYNQQNGFFDEWLKYIPKFSKDYGLLYIDGKKTDVPIRTVRYIVSCLENSSTPMTTLLKLEKAHECPQWIYRAIGTNYKNSELVNLFDKPIVEIENNPQKRKEMGL